MPAAPATAFDLPDRLAAKADSSRTSCLSITHAPLVAQGVAANMRDLDQSISRDNGTLDYCRLHDITVQAWSPFQGGFFDGVFLGSDKYPELNAVLDRLADEYGVSPIAIATAWITRHPAQMQVVLGTTTPERVTAAAQGSEIPLTRSQWYELLRTAGLTAVRGATSPQVARDGCGCGGV